MANSLFNAMNNKPNQNDFWEAFPVFVRQINSNNPTGILNDLISSGKVSQQQLDIVQKKAQQIQQTPGMLEKIKSMFK